MKTDGYKALNFDGVNHYYKVEDEDEWEVMQAKRNVVTSIIDDNITIFSNNFTALKTLLAHISTLNTFDLTDDLKEMVWSDSDYGYILLDDEISVANIIEKEEYDQTASEEEIYARNPNLRCKHTLDEIQSMLHSLKYGCDVKVSSTDGGSVNVSVVEGGYTDYGTYKYGTVLELTATPDNDDFVFIGWSDGYKGSVRRVSVPCDVNYEAVFQKATTFLYTINGVNTVTIIGYIGGDVDIVIPATVVIGNVEYTITSIGDEAFKNNTNLQSVTFAENSQVVSIGAYAFYGTNLQSLTLPLSVGYIGPYVCEPSNNVVLNAIFAMDTWYVDEDYSSSINPNDIYSGALVMSDGIYRRHYYFEYEYNDNNTATLTGYVGNMQWLEIPATIVKDGVTYTVTAIGANALENSTELQIVTFSDESRVATIGEKAFYGCTNLQQFTLPNSVGYVGANFISYNHDIIAGLFNFNSNNGYWYVDEDYGGSFNYDDVINGDRELFAMWRMHYYFEYECNDNDNTATITGYDGDIQFPKIPKTVKKKGETTGTVYEYDEKGKLKTNK